MNVRFLSSSRPALYLCALALLLRLAAIVISPAHLWAYTVYFDMARNLVDGGGYCLDPGGRLCAFFPPVYPSLVGAAILTRHPGPAIAVIGSLMGAGTVWMTWLMGARLFGPLAGVVAAAYATIYPYFVWHDPVLQETSTLAFMVAVSVYLLIRAHDSASRWLWLAAGAALALTVLTKANLLLFVPAALLCIALFSSGGRPQRVRRFLWASLGVVLLLGPWIIRTWRITGTPILYSNGGFALWTSNHRLTFNYFPERSIDDAHIPEWNDLTPAEQHEFNSLPDDPQDILHARWYWKKGMSFVLAHPALTLGRGLQKIWIAFSPRFSPAQGAAFEVVYFVSYFPLLVLAVAGMWRTRARWRELACMFAAIVTFAAGSAVLWAHTSHRMYLEPYLMIFAAAAITGRGKDTSAAGAAVAGSDKES